MFYLASHCSSVISVFVYNVEKEFGLTIHTKDISEKDFNTIKSLPKDYTVKVKDEILEIKLV